MGREVNGRTYDASRRRAAAEDRRRRVLAAARELFVARGYDATSVADVAARAGVAVDTVYAAVGRKPQLLIAVHDMELAAQDAPVTAEQRDYVRAIQRAPSARAKLEVYVAALAERLPRTVPLALALRDAGTSDPDCRATYESLTARRMGNMRRLAADLRTTGELREELDDDRVADLLGSMNSPEYYALLTDRGYRPEDYAELVLDVWSRTLLS